MMPFPSGEIATENFVSRSLSQLWARSERLLTTVASTYRGDTAVSTLRRISSSAATNSRRSKAALTLFVYATFFFETRQTSKISVF